MPFLAGQIYKMNNSWNKGPWTKTGVIHFQKTVLLIFRTVAEPWNSGKSAKCLEIWLFFPGSIRSPEKSCCLTNKSNSIFNFVTRSAWTLMCVSRYELWPFTRLGGLSKFHAMPIFTIQAVKVRKIFGMWVKFLFHAVNTPWKIHGYRENFTQWKSL